MRKNLGLLAILAVVIVVVAVSGCSNNNTSTNTNNVSAAGTKIAMFNNGTTWAHMEIVANATHKNGTNMTIWADLFVKPGGNVTIDLSQLLGYGNAPLPEGTVIRVQSWKGLFNTTGGGTGTLNIALQGWSNTLTPGPNDQKVPITYNPLSISTLPANVTDNIAFIATNPTDLAKIQPIDTSDQEPVYEEEVITIGANGQVTITVTRVPELCRAIASIV